MIEHEFDVLYEAGKFLQINIEQDLKKRISQDGYAILILPGGNSIKLFFPYLLNMNLSWEKIIIGLSDERCVPKDHDLSNEKQLKQCFLNFIPNPNYCELNKKFIKKIQKSSPITVLSMGNDGHVASLFPEEFIDWNNKGIGLYNTKKQKPNRISLTERTVLLSDKIYVLVLGRKKIIKLSLIGKDPVNSYLLSVFNKSRVLILND